MVCLNQQGGCLSKAPRPRFASAPGAYVQSLLAPTMDAFLLLSQGLSALITLPCCPSFSFFPLSFASYSNPFCCSNPGRKIKQQTTLVSLS